MEASVPDVITLSVNKRLPRRRAEPEDLPAMSKTNMSADAQRRGLI